MTAPTKVIATPARLQRPDLTPEERKELNDKYGVQPLSPEEMNQRKRDDADAKAEKEAAVEAAAAREADLQENAWKYSRAEEFAQIPQGDKNDELFRAIEDLYAKLGQEPPESVKAMLDRRNEIKEDNPKPVESGEVAAPAKK